MELNEISLAPFKEVVRVIEKWKIIPLKYSATILDKKFSRATNYRLFESMEKFGLARRLKLTNTSGMCLVPSKGLADYLKIPMNYDQFDHDKVVSYVAAGFLKAEAFSNHDLTFEHEFTKFNAGTLIPDIVFHGISPKSGDEFHLAVEVELSRKSFAKIDAKIANYIQDSTFDLIIYAFASEDLFNLFKKRIENYPNKEFQERVKEKITLVLVENYLTFPDEIFGSKCLHNGIDGFLGEFF
jgi:hypothetical protein